MENIIVENIIREFKYLPLINQLTEFTAIYLLKTCYDFAAKKSPICDEKEIFQNLTNEGVNFTFFKLKCLKNSLLDFLYLVKRRKYSEETVDILCKILKISELMMQILKTYTTQILGEKEREFNYNKLLNMEWKIEYDLSSSKSVQVRIPKVHLVLKYADGDGNIKRKLLYLTLSEFMNMKTEMKQINDLLN